MAGQDLKNFTRIWNPILEAMTKAKFTANQYKICLALFQNTYAWHKTEARISYRDFERETGIKAKKISQPFRQLVKLNVIIEVEEPSFNAPGLYKFNKDIRQWSTDVLDINQISETNLLIVAEECGGTVPKKGTPPQDGDSPQNEGEGPPRNGGEGPPRNGDTKQPSKPCGASDSGDLKKIYKENTKEIYPTTTNNARAREVNLIEKFQQELGRPLSPLEVEQIQKWEQEMPSDLIVEALKRAVLSGTWSFKYIDRILLDWKKNNVQTLLDVKRQDQEFLNRKNKRAGPVNRPAKEESQYAKLGNARPEDFL